MPYEAEIQKRYRERHREELRKRQQRYRESHREEIKNRRQLYGDSHREEIKQRNKAYNLAHPWDSQYRLDHLDAIRVNTCRWYHAHREEELARTRIYRQTHPDVIKAIRQRRRARQRGSHATLTTGQWKAIKVAYGNKCAYCGKSYKSLQQDHVIPLSKGGATIAENIVPACGRCNSSKGNRPAPILPARRLMM